MRLLPLLLLLVSLNILSLDLHQAGKSILQIQKGWVGGDGACSVSLDDNQILFAFGDTLIGERNSQERKYHTFLNNSLGIYHKNTDKWSFFYFPKKAFFIPPKEFCLPDEKSFFWPVNIIKIDNSLIFFLYYVKYTNINDGLGFKVVDTFIAKVNNWQVPVMNWKPSYQKLSMNRNNYLFGTAAIIVENWCYVYGVRDFKNHGHTCRLASVCRLKPSDLLSMNFDKVEYLTDSKGTFQLESSFIFPMFQHCGSEISVHFQYSSNEFLLFYSPDGMSMNGVYRASANPWDFYHSEEKLFHTISPHLNSQYFSYAIKAHPGLCDKKNNIVFSYVTNSFTAEDLNKDPNIYIPIFQNKTIK